ncbi:diguanylate cyclase domain-containing protein [Treponema sp.]|uniref:sensor domain-containing diguanylate cyclase n=1 Tax=Treponema sp. TaxID=166 RepID=UPI0038904153
MALVLVAAASVSLFWFEKAVNGTVSESSRNFLKETGSLYAGTFRVKLNDQLFMLESQARYFQNINMDDYNAVKATIISTKGVGEFKRIAVANSSGMTINYDGKSSGNILMKDYFKNAMKGRPQISSKISVDEDGEKVLTLAVPIFQNEKIVGVITGTFAYSVLDDIFSVDTFDGEGYSILSNKDGSILVATKSPNRLCFVDNWFDFFTDNKSISISQVSAIYNDVQSNRTGVFSFSLNDESRIVVYTPVGMNDWYVVSSVTADYVLSQQSKITRITLTLILIMLAIFVIIAVFISRLVIQKARIERDNSRYAINSENSQTLIYEYDFEHKVIEFTGNTVFLFGENLKQLPLSDFDRISSKIHETENDLLKRLTGSIMAGKNSYSTELRLLNSENEYVWYRLSGTVIYDKENQNPLKFIGNIVNVNAQVVHEQELKIQAETDLLSGLLNKVYMEKSVSEYISKNEKSTIGALYIIDLDNFKQVNDKLGHSFGDQAICDTANKLSLVFSEKDFIGRIGGDEFCVFLCLKNTVKNAKAIVEEKARILKDILAEDYSNGECSVLITPSIGISLFPEQEKSFKNLFKKSDIALYNVKNSGKNNFAIYSEEMGTKGESVYE